MASRTNPIDPTFGTRLRALRKAKRMTQLELSAAAGINNATLIRLERFQRAPMWDTAVALADALGVSVAEFRGEGEGCPAS